MEKSNIKFLTISRAKELEESSAFLSNYDGADNEEEHIITLTNKDDKDIELSKLFFELGEINKRRSEILKIFLNKSI